MLKLRRDLARALTLLELVARRERAKRDLLRLTALLSERRYHAQDFASHLPPELPQRWVLGMIRSEKTGRHRYMLLTNKL